MDPNKRFSLDQINKLKRSAPQGMASVDKKPRVAYTSTRGVSGVHPQGPHVAPRRPPTLEPKRFETPLFNIPVQNTSSQIHTQSNNTASLPLMVRPFVDGSHHNLQPGDILFVKKNNGGRYLRTVKNIFMLNHHLVTLAEENVENALKEAREWMFYGMYRNETNVTNAPMPGTYYPPSQNKNHQSLINVDVFGRSNIINIFGDPNKRRERCRSGDLVGLALYSSTADKKVMYLPTRNGTPTFTLEDAKKHLDIPLGVVTFPKRTGRFPKVENLSQQHNKDNKKMCSMEILIV